MCLPPCRHSGLSSHPYTPISGKRKKLPAKRGRASEDPTPNFYLTKFVNEGAADRFGTICKNRSFIKKRASTTPTISLARPLRLRDGGRYANHLVQLRRVWYENFTPTSPPMSLKRSGCVVDFSTQSINQFYNLDPVPPEPFDRLYERPDYPEVIRVLTNGRGEWKLNSEGHAVHLKEKHLAYIPKVWHHFITSRLISTMNVCEVTAKRALLNYAIIQDIPFDVGQVIEDAILHNWDAKNEPGAPFSHIRFMQASRGALRLQ